jgi:hypothetical protein
MAKKAEVRGARVTLVASAVARVLKTKAARLKVALVEDRLVILGRPEKRETVEAACAASDSPNLRALPRFLYYGEAERQVRVLDLANSLSLFPGELILVETFEDGRWSLKVYMNAEISGYGEADPLPHEERDFPFRGRSDLVEYAA